MQNQGGAVLRGDLLTFVEEASGVDKLFIADKVFPQFGVDLKDGTYPKFTLDGGSELLDGDVTERAPGGAYGRVSRQFVMDTYSTKDRGVEEPVDVTQSKEFKRFFDAEVVMSKLCLRRMKIAAEIRAAARLIDTAAFATNNALVTYTAAHLADGTVDPVTDILGAIDRLNGRGYMPNTILLSHYVFTYLRRSAKMQNFIRGNRPSDSEIHITDKMLAEAFGVEQVLVGRAPKNVARKGKATSVSAIWPTTHIWVGELKGGDPHEGGAGRTFVWNEEGGLYVTETYFEDKIRSEIVRVRQHTIEKIVDGLSGELIATSFA
jgi:hypothetical protein